MSFAQLLKDVDQLTLDQCRQLSSRLRQRVGQLSREPSLEILRQAKPGRTASLMAGRHLVCGRIVELTGNCCMLQFADGGTLLCCLAELMPKGFGRKATVLPGDLVGYGVAEPSAAADRPLPVLYDGKPYQPVKVGPKMVAARELLPGPMLEPLDRNKVCFLKRPETEIEL